MTGDADAMVFVALGANLETSAGGPEATLRRALEAFPEFGLGVKARSRFWRSAAWPDPADPPFVNAVAEVETVLSPEDLLEALHSLEVLFGRNRTLKNGPRTLDLDLIAYGREVRRDGLILPHPRATERLFVMGPLAEIAPRWRHPVSGDLAADLSRRTTVGTDAAPL